MCAQNAGVSVISVFSWRGAVSYLGKLIPQHETVALIEIVSLKLGVIMLTHLFIFWLCFHI